MPDKATIVKTIIANRVGRSESQIVDTQDFQLDLGIDPNDQVMLNDFSRQWPLLSQPGYKAAKVKHVGEAVSYIENNTK